MRIWPSIAAAVLLAATLSACQPAAPQIAEIPYAPDSGNLFVRCGSLIDGLSDEVLQDRMVVIRDGRVAAIVDGSAEVRPGMTLFDLSDKTCLPGLINMHVHLLERGADAVDYGVYFRNDAEVFHARVLEAAAQALLTGFTTVRNVGDYFPAPIVFGRNEIAAGRALGPRIQTGGPFLTIPGGGGAVPAVDYDAADTPAAAQLGIAQGADEFRQKALHAVAEGADFLKVIASGAVFAFGTEPGAPEMTQAEIEAVVAVAHEAGIKVTAHVHSAQSGRDAILAGVDSLEHASL
ncbi:MAG: amidohydrolase family protein, partial [Gammaproteobacteria bacterium]|nr:amidohydrolase family protein [Gammaproteobacteria bacterium]